MHQVTEKYHCCDSGPTTSWLPPGRVVSRAILGKKGESVEPERIVETTADGQKRVGPVNAALTPRWVGPATFARLPRTDQVDHTDIAVVGIPFDSGVSYRSGARFGPNHVRESSRLLRPYNPAQNHSPGIC